MRIFAAAALALSACSAGTSSNPADEDSALFETQRQVLLFDGFDSGVLDRETWNVVGPEFRVNDEEQAYIDDPSVLAFEPEAADADGGVLVLRPIFKPGVDTHPERQADFVSGRIESQGKFDFTYGRAEARIKMPDAVGVWPAFWLLGEGRWPDTGEIDIMEYVGEKEWTAVALHGPGYAGDTTPFVDRYYFPQGEDATGWHVYAVEWTPDMIQFEIDGRITYRVTRKMIEPDNSWSYDNPKYLILNFAVGGAYPAKNNRASEPYYGLPQEAVDQIKAGEIEMMVDWIRVLAPERQD